MEAYIEKIRKDPVGMATEYIRDNDIKDVFRWANIHFFLGALDSTQVDVYLVSNRSMKVLMDGDEPWAIATDHGEFQEIHLSEVNDWEILFGCLLHEMIHVFEAQQGLKMKHGKLFKKFAKIFEKLGFDVR